MSEIEESLKMLMAQPGVIGYVVINSDGIPVRVHPEEELPSVQYAALIADLVMKTKQTLKQLSQSDNDFVNLRMRTKSEIEIIVTDVIMPGGHEYILVTLQKCKFGEEVDESEEKKEGEDN